MTASATISIAIVAATLVAILVRPRGLSEAWTAAIGATVMVVIGPMQLVDVPDVLHETSDVLLFLAGMMVLTVLVERAGVFEVLAEACARLARGSGVALFCLVFVLGAVITAVLSLDVTVIVLTPIIYAITVRRQLHALPFLFVCTFVANTASLVFPISNLTNLLVSSQLDIRFGDFAARMWLPNLAAFLANLLVFLWLFRAQIPRRFEFSSDTTLPAIDWWFIVSAATLIATLVTLFVLGFAHRPLGWAALGGAAVLLVIGVVSRKVPLQSTLHDVSWPVLVFVVGMLIVVRGLERGWLDSLIIDVPSSPTRALLVGVVTTAIGSNIVNNVPMALLALPVIERTSGPVREALAYGVLVGTNIGPTLTTYGSLATMLWLALIRKRGIVVSTRDYLRVGLASTAPILVATTVTLWIVLR
jgi:arsenical pump membrane protein